MPRTPDKKLTSSTATKYEGKSLCCNLQRPVPQLPPSVVGNPRRAGAINLGRGKWANGTVLHYCFFTHGHFAVPKKQADAISTHELGHAVNDQDWHVVSTSRSSSTEGRFARFAGRRSPNRPLEKTSRTSTKYLSQRPY